MSYIGLTRRNKMIKGDTTIYNEMCSPMDTIEAKQPIGNKLDKIKHMLEREKQKDYGDPNIKFQRIANYWNNYLGQRSKLRDCLTKRDVAIMMTLFKIARINEHWKEDTIDDIIGYATLCGSLDEGLEEFAESSAMPDCDKQRKGNEGYICQVVTR